MEYSTHEVATAAGTTARTLRHYDSIGLLTPRRVGRNGYRYYDDRSLVRLQRILLLRQLGLGLSGISELLSQQEPSPAAEARALTDHLHLLRAEQHQLAAQIASVERTIAALERSGADQEGHLMSQNIFDGFDHSAHREEVEQRWGPKAYASGAQWWDSLGAAGQTEWTENADRLSRDWAAAAARGEDPGSTAAQNLARRHVEWLEGIPGTRAHGRDGDLNGYLLGLGDLYVADERFAATYGGADGAAFVRDALRRYVDWARS